MPPHQTTQEPPIDLPVGLNARLLDRTPAPGCEACAAEWRSLKAAETAGNIGQAAKHATAVRDHAGGHQ
ncbi:hypothetical protein [Streptomyces tagetis]|uniref:Uncharacterized protein n=1 Tax=Streptomyces tagetis TaxID=2820809 RepID=A0A940XJH5_9ACTN|nr:hypothetical protein [Streptomyces sp. RG38]MBQ0825770.1 hypothetical protein [Streptomyces sp. RG38]